jgi:hypothetical protein
MDFENWDEGAEEVDPRDPIALYETLDRQQTHVELRDAQVKILQQWQARRDEKDLVIKLATGAGKTTLGLVMLWSHMRETGKPVVYLCPNKQLIEQVIEEGRRCGIACLPFSADNRIPPLVYAAEAVLVTTVKKLFNAKAKSVLARGAPFEPVALLLDDAHAALEIARDAFTIRAPKNSDVYSRLFNLFEGALSEQSAGGVACIKADDVHRTAEVPYWSWIDQQGDVATILATADKRDAPEVMWVWGLLADYVPGLRCVFSGAKVEVAPEVLPVATVPIYSTVPHRIFMSATISDDAALVRDLGCAVEAARSPIELSDAGGLGERMVIVPGLMEAGKAPMSRVDLMELCKKLAERHTVAVITPSTPAARDWATVANTVVVDGTDITQSIASLRTANPQLVVFANRYDGIDLPDDACRVLVLDGAPVARSLFDSVDGSGTDSVNARRRSVIHRVEQGLGRAVRSRSDYAAVILYGPDLVELISHQGMRMGMTDETRLQIELGLEIAKRSKDDGDIKKTVSRLVDTCLQREAGWKAVYARKVKGARQPVDPDTREARLALADAERQAWQAYVANRGEDAAGLLTAFLDTSPMRDALRWWILQRAAWYARATNPARSLEWQKAACANDTRALRPPQGTQYQKQAAKQESAAAAIIDWFNEFAYGNGALAAVDGLRSRLVFARDASSDRFEEALRDLGAMLGLHAERPEKDHGRGPDVLWLAGQISMPLEAKNNVDKNATVISKGDIEQLSQSVAWTKEIFTDRPDVVPLMAHPTSQVSSSAIPPEKMRVFTPERLSAFVDAVARFMAALVALSAGQRDVKRVAQLLEEHRLTLQTILADYTVKAQ